MTKIATTTGALPSSMILTDIERESADPLDYGGLSDVYSGQIVNDGRKTKVALKVPRRMLNSTSDTNDFVSHLLVQSSPSLLAHFSLEFSR